MGETTNLNWLARFLPSTAGRPLLRALFVDIFPSPSQGAWSDFMPVFPRGGLSDVNHGPSTGATAGFLNHQHQTSPNFGKPPPFWRLQVDQGSSRKHRTISWPSHASSGGSRHVKAHRYFLYYIWKSQWRPWKVLVKLGEPWCDRGSKNCDTNYLYIYSIESLGVVGHKRLRNLSSFRKEQINSKW